jgi:hypothetical protein
MLKSSTWKNEDIKALLKVNCREIMDIRFCQRKYLFLFSAPRKNAGMLPVV